jgi:mannose-1-phosphate guanylyltransferase/mannose-6-phosphate isomerase
MILPSDHVVLDATAFQKAMAVACAFAEKNEFVTFGVKPSAPETGYGYIQAGESLSKEAFRLARFVEKPDVQKARTYAQAGCYYWNSGIFVFKASAWISEMNRQAPKIIEACLKTFEARKEDHDFCRLSKEIFEACPSDSIDYAVMEKVEQGVVIPVDMGWSDLGSWEALYEMGEKDSNGNVKRGDIVAMDSSHCYLQSEDRLLAVLGVNDLVVVETKDAILVAKRSEAQHVKKLVDELKAKGRKEEF